MKKTFTTALVMAAAMSAQAQHNVVLQYGGEEVTLAKGEKVDTVNWYWDAWRDADDFTTGEITTGDADDEASNGKVMTIINPDGAGNGQNWERCLKFDGLQIKPATIYRVSLTAKGQAGSPVQMALMCGDENCDMQFLGAGATSKNDAFAYDVTFNQDAFTTRSAMFYYASDELQQQYYHDVKPDDTNALGANRFLRLSFKGVGTYLVDQVLVEEAPIAGIYFGGSVIKIDFGFQTNAAALANAAEEGTAVLDASLFTVTVNGEVVAPISAEAKKDGGVYLFLSEPLSDEDVVTVSFKNNGCGLQYSGALTPGNGTDVVSFEAEAGSYDETVSEVESILLEEAKLVSTYPVDGSFELDNDISEFSFTFNKDVFVCGDNAPEAMLVGNGIEEELEAVAQPNELGRTVTFKRTSVTPLPKGAYSVIITEGTVQTELEIQTSNEIRIDIEVGKVSVASVEYTDVESVGMIGENGTQTENWDTYFGGELRTEDGETRCFAFAEGGLYTRGFYLCQRGAEVGSELVYGDKVPFTLPAGDVQITLKHSKWQGGGGNISYELTNAAGDVVAKGATSAETNQADQGQVVDVTKTAIRIPGCAAGNYRLRVVSAEGWGGTIFYGFDVQTYKMSAGETADNEVLLNASFSDVPGDGVPAAGSGFTVYQNNEMLEKGSVAGQRTRFMNLNNCSGLSNGFYNRDLGGATQSNYMTYGEDDPNGGEEPKLMLDNVKYNFSWMACNWKGESNTYFFEILDEDGDVVYHREDVVTANVNGNSQAAEAQKIEFSFTPAQADRYILKWYMTGESVLGKIKVEKMGSLAVYWHTQLNEAIAAAKEELANAAEDKYAGTTRDALANAISEAENVTFHTGVEYQAAIDDLAVKVKDMVARRNALADYDAAYNALAEQIAKMAETKYAALPSYTSGRALVEQYDGVEGWTIENETLLPVVQELKDAKALNDNLMDIGVKAFTDQATKLAATYVEFCEEEFPDENEVVIAAGNALSDDQALVSKLKMMATSALYKKIASGFNFVEVNEEEGWEENITVNLSGFIRNSVFYAITDNRELANSDACNEAFPGWQFDAPNGLCADWGWGGWSGNNQPVAPVNVTNSQAGTKWGTDFELWQDITDVPVGIYNIGGDVTDRSNVGDDNLIKDGYETMSYLYVTVGEEKSTLTFDISNIGQYYGLTETLVPDVVVNAGSDGITGAVTLGAVMDVEASFAAMDNAKMFMTAKVDGFDYAAAAAKLDKAILDGIKDIQVVDRTDAPASVLYYDLSGKQTSAPQGVCIKVERWADGYMRVVKTIKK